MAGVSCNSLVDVGATKKQCNEWCYNFKNRPMIQKIKNGRPLLWPYIFLIEHNRISYDLKIIKLIYAGISLKYKRSN